MGWWKVVGGGECWLGLVGGGCGEWCVESAFVFFVAFGWVVVGAFVGELVLGEVGVKVCGEPVEEGVNFEGVEVGVPLDGAEVGGALWVLFAS